MRGGGAGPFALGVLSQLLTVLRLWYEVSLEQHPDSAFTLGRAPLCVPPVLALSCTPAAPGLRRVHNDMLPPDADALHWPRGPCEVAVTFSDATCVTGGPGPLR